MTHLPKFVLQQTSPGTNLGQTEQQLRCFARDYAPLRSLRFVFSCVLCYSYKALIKPKQTQTLTCVFDFLALALSGSSVSDAPFSRWRLALFIGDGSSSLIFCWRKHTIRRDIRTLCPSSLNLLRTLKASLGVSLLIVVTYGQLGNQLYIYLVHLCYT